MKKASSKHKKTVLMHNRNIIENSERFNVPKCAVVLDFIVGESLSLRAESGFYFDTEKRQDGPKPCAGESLLVKFGLE